MAKNITRRDLLHGGALVAASAALPFSAAPMARASAPMPPSPIRLGIASYTFRKFDEAHLIDFMKQLRTPYLNLKDVHLPMEPLSDVKAKADQYRAAGLKITAGGTITFAKADDEDIRQKFDYCKAAGIPIIVGSPTHEALPLIEKFVKQYDIKLAIHNHGPEDKLWPSPMDVLAAVSKMDPRIGCCIDVGHTMRTGTDPVEAIRKAGPRLLDMHMKDLAKSTVKESQVAVGEGLMPVRDIFKALIDMKYPGDVDLEYEIKENDPLPGVMESFAYMRGVLSGMGYSTGAETIS